MARASSVTYLSLDRWAQILGLNPVHFAGAKGATVWPQSAGFCSMFWPQHPWQTDELLISREEVARSIRVAEQSIANYLRFLPAPGWIAAEEVEWTRNYDRVYSTYPATVHTRYRHLISPGRRATTLLEAEVAVVYSDEDGDNFDETATITVSDLDVEEVCEIQVFFAGKNADPAWQIRPLKLRELSAGVFTCEIDRWLLIDPALWEAHPQTRYSPINLDDSSSVVESVDVYRVYNDVSAVSSQLLWSTGTLCSSCQGQGCARCGADGCWMMVNPRTGAVQPHAATYTDGAWVYNSTVTAQPAAVRLWYYSGYQSQDYLNGYSCDPLDDLMAQAITMLATARLPKPICSCSNAKVNADDWRKDLAISSRTEFNSSMRRQAVVNNPFGTRAGEVRAWEIISGLFDDTGYFGDSG